MGGHGVASGNGASSLQANIERGSIRRPKEILVQQVILAGGDDKIGEAIFPKDTALRISADNNKLPGHANVVVDLLVGNKTGASTVLQVDRVLVAHLTIPYRRPC